MVEAGAGFGVASCIGAEWIALADEHMKQIVQILEACFGMALAFEVVCMADTPAGIVHTVDIAGCKGCTQGTAADSTVSIGSAVAAAGTTAQLLEFG